MLRFLPAIVLAAWALAAALGARDDGAAMIALAVITIFVLVEIHASIDRHFGGRR